MKYCKKRLTYIMLMLLTCLIFNFADREIIFAENTTTSSGVDVVFVIDASKSMLKSDPKGLSSEAMKMFIDMCHSKGDKGGMVAYSGEVVKESSLKYMNSEQDKSSLKGTLEGLGQYNWTDIGLGLKRAVSLINAEHDKNNKPIIILLSDGKNDPKRDKKSSIDDLSEALNQAKTQSLPIYSIGLNADGTVDKAQLEAISKDTNAKSFITNNADELPKILREIFADNSRLKILQDSTIIGNDNFQDVKIHIPDDNVVEANISILSSKPVELKLKDAKGKDVKLPSENILYTTSHNYSMLKLISPEKGEWALRIKGSNMDKVDISLISNYDLKAGIKITPDSNLHRADKIGISAYIESNGQKLEDIQFYSTLKASANIKNLTNGETKELPLQLQDNAFKGEYVLPDNNKYAIKVIIEGPGFIRESEVKNILSENITPSLGKKANNNTLWSKKSKEMIALLLIILLLIIFIMKIFKNKSNTKSSSIKKANKIDSTSNLQCHKALNPLIRIHSTNMLMNLNLWNIKLKDLRKYNSKSLDTTNSQCINTSISILAEIEKSKAIYEIQICEKIESLSASERNELFGAIKRLYIDKKENFSKASYLIFNYSNFSADNFNIIWILRNSPVDYDSLDNLVKYIMMKKRLEGIIRYINHLSIYRDNYLLENSYFEKILLILIDKYNLLSNKSYKRLNNELAKIINTIVNSDDASK